MRPRVLIVDDYEDSLLFFVEELRDANYDVTGTTSPNEALSIALRTAPAVIVTDIAMPGMDGHELARLLRSYNPTRQAKLIVVSAHPASMAPTLAPPGGWDAWLQKPLEYGALADAVRSVLAVTDPFARRIGPVPIPSEEEEPPSSRRSGTK